MTIPEPFQLLDRLYALSDADTLRMVLIEGLASEFDSVEDDLEAPISELMWDGLATSTDAGPTLQITAQGIRAAERDILSAPDHSLKATVQRRMDDRVRLLDHVANKSDHRPHRAVGDLDELGWAPDRLWPTAHYLADGGLVSVEGHLLAITPTGLRFLKSSGTDPSLRL